MCSKSIAALIFLIWLSDNDNHCLVLYWSVNLRNRIHYKQRLHTMIRIGSNSWTRRPWVVRPSLEFSKHVYLEPIPVLMCVVRQATHLTTNQWVGCLRSWWRNVWARLSSGTIGEKICIVGACACLKLSSGLAPYFTSVTFSSSIPRILPSKDFQSGNGWGSLHMHLHQCEYHW